MHAFKVTFSVDGIRSETVVYAYTAIDARKLVEYQYYGHNVTVYMASY